MGQDFIAKLPRRFSEVILGAFRDEGRRWLENLLQIVAEIEQHWSLKINALFPNLSYHFVAPGTFDDGSEAVVKIGFPGEAHNILNERDILAYLDGKSVNRLLDFDEKHCAFLLEKLIPGENLKTVCGADDQKAVAIAIETMRAFWQKPPEVRDFPPLEAWFDGLKRAASTAFDPKYAAQALRFFEELNSSSAEKMLLHGDFHHENILSAQRAAFLAIDPKGIVGHRAYDIAVFLINHAGWLKTAPDRRRKLTGAIEMFSDAFEIEPYDLRRWVFAQSVLSAWWTFEENCENWKSELELTKIWEV